MSFAVDASLSQPTLKDGKDLPQSGRSALRIYTKVLVGMTLLLIFAGAQVKSNDAGLSVPDWPTTYGQNMFTFPFSKWVGGIFYEHSHRLIASGVGLLTLTLAVWLFFVEQRRWVRILGYSALGAVIAQGVLGGLTVLLLLPPPVSIMHGVLAQTFLVLTIVIAYSQSKEFERRSLSVNSGTSLKFFRLALSASGAIYIQLILGALMRHTASGLAVPDFPTMGGSWLPSLSSSVLAKINAERLAMGLRGVEPYQVVLHLIHRGWAVVVTLEVFTLFIRILKNYRNRPEIVGLGHLLALGVIVQFLFGVLTVLSARAPEIASVHVFTGAVLLALSVVLCLRAYPLNKTVDTK